MLIKTRIKSSIRSQTITNKMKISLGVLTVLIALTVSKRLPSNFKICDHFAPNLNECLYDAVLSALHQMKNGLREIDAPPLDPVIIPNATIEKGEFTINFNDIHVYNVTDAVIHKINATATTERFYATMFAGVEEILGVMNYNLKGKLLLFTIDGGGKAIIRFKNITFDMVLDGEVVEKNGAPHYSLTSFSVKLDPKLITFDMQDIFRERKDLTEAFNIALNQNWDVFFGETQAEFEEILSQFFMQYANNVFKYVPVQTQ
ncbi:hypothetical protein RI129_010439 [Pyrocoelia pectoralis]|uniref:Uncharacterized protein n=1 Tax=Pyrocoelia pectoralis TaxID=417401 RepID=A0AAN7V6Q9_9COLE